MTEQNPAVVLVHGAFAESASWNGVIERLEQNGLECIAVANPLRSLSGDAAYVRDVIAAVGRPVVLVGHSYGGLVISEAAAGERSGERARLRQRVRARARADGVRPVVGVPGQHPRRRARAAPARRRERGVGDPAGVVPSVSSARTCPRRPPRSWRRRSVRSPRRRSRSRCRRRRPPGRPSRRGASSATRIGTSRSQSIVPAPSGRSARASREVAGRIARAQCFRAGCCRGDVFSLPWPLSERRASERESS